MSTNDTIPRSPLWLGLAGWIPFWIPVALTVQAALTGRSPAAEGGLYIVYAAIILGFLGGVRWGRGLAPDGTGSGGLYVLSILPSLIGLGAAFLYWAGQPEIAFATVFAGLILHWRWDSLAVRREILPAWYGRLRSILTLGAGLSALAMLGIYPVAAG